ncbi:MAG: kanamycin nucleotidyltransferase C-terminal domain-containing protein [Candidatus Sumerlaeaceae bacterium]
MHISIATLFGVELKLHDPLLNQWAGPQARSQTDRQQLANHLLRRLRAELGENLLAAAAYGSFAKGTDKPYSDFEMFAVVNSPKVSVSYEWVTRWGKAELNIYGLDVVRCKAASVPLNWSLSHSRFVRCLPLTEELTLFEELRETVLNAAQPLFIAAIREIILADLYEGMGKLRNLDGSCDSVSLPSLACDVTKSGALLLGLAHRFLYSSASTMLTESATLPRIPDGYKQLCRLVSQGNISDPTETTQAMERFWAGIKPWLQESNIIIDLCKEPESF